VYRTAWKRGKRFQSSLVNALTAEVDLGAGNFTGFPTYRPLGRRPPPVGAISVGVALHGKLPRVIPRDSRLPKVYFEFLWAFLAHGATMGITQ